jgi:hypothetical protein
MNYLQYIRTKVFLLANGEDLTFGNLSNNHRLKYVGYGFQPAFFVKMLNEFQTS